MVVVGVSQAGLNEYVRDTADVRLREQQPVAPVGVPARPSEDRRPPPPSGDVGDDMAPRGTHAITRGVDYDGEERVWILIPIYLIKEQTSEAGSREPQIFFIPGRFLAGTLPGNNFK